MKAKKTILICPLDWGMGHATRMMPVINYLLKLGYNIQLGAASKTLLVLKNHYPHLKAHILPKISPRYTRLRGSLMPILILQSPLIIFSSIKENFVVRKLIKTQNIDFVISDNRFGLWNLPVPSAYITHQCHIELHGFYGIFSGLFSAVHRFIIRKHDALFIPDATGDKSLAGKLSKTSPKIKGRHLGLLSQFSGNGTKESKKEGYVLILLSGQEPQRSVLEKRLLSQVGEIDRKFILVKGKISISGDTTIHVPKNVTIINFATSHKLQQLIVGADVVICRSGYSSLMDLAILEQKAILVPTNGQAEQIYLAKYLKEKGWYYSMNQLHINIKEALEEVEHYHPPKNINKGYSLEPIHEWIRNEEQKHGHRRK